MLSRNFVLGLYREWLATGKTHDLAERVLDPSVDFLTEAIRAYNDIKEKERKVFTNDVLAGRSSTEKAGLVYEEFLNKIVFLETILDGTTAEVDGAEYLFGWISYSNMTLEDFYKSEL